MHCSDTAQLVFEDVRVPAKNIIGEEGQGFMYQMIQFQAQWLNLLVSKKISMLCERFSTGIIS